MNSLSSKWSFVSQFVSKSNMQYCRCRLRVKTTILATVYCILRLIRRCILEDALILREKKKKKKKKKKKVTQYTIQADMSKYAYIHILFLTC